MAHAQKQDFVYRRKGRVHFNRRVRQFSRLLEAEVCASAVVMLDTPCSEVVWRVLATHSIRHIPLHFPSRASPCSITYQLEPTTDNTAKDPANTVCLERKVSRKNITAPKRCSEMFPGSTLAIECRAQTKSNLESWMGNEDRVEGRERNIFHCTHSNGICHTGLLTARKLSAYLYDIYHWLIYLHLGSGPFSPDEPSPSFNRPFVSDMYHCCVHSEKLLMMDRGTVRNI